MALGGGTFQTQNKALPGAYINFISAARNLVGLSERGIVAMPFQLGWGPENQVIELDADNFRMFAPELFGYSPDAPELLIFREVFRHARRIVAYRMAKTAVKATNAFATAKYSGTRGNDLKIVIQANVDNPSAFDVTILLDFKKVFEQRGVASATELRENEYVTWNQEAVLVKTAATPLEGGTNGAELTPEDHQRFLMAVEGRAFHVLVCPSLDELTATLYVEFTRRMRDDVGAKFQLVTVSEIAPDYEGVIVVDHVAPGKEVPVCYWVAGAAAGCEINRSLTNMEYDGELGDVGVDRTQYELAKSIQDGKLVFHRVGDSWNLLEDVDSLTTVTNDKGEQFKSSQTIRIIDQIGTDIARVFNEGYLGKVQNDVAGRTSLWNDVVKILQQMHQRRAIQPFEPDTVKVDPGLTPKSVLVNCTIQPVSAMTQLYMTVIID